MSHEPNSACGPPGQDTVHTVHGHHMSPHARYYIEPSDITPASFFTATNASRIQVQPRRGNNQPNQGLLDN